jgi:hypothetical protein
MNEQGSKPLSTIIDPNGRGAGQQRTPSDVAGAPVRPAAVADRRHDHRPGHRPRPGRLRPLRPARIARSRTARRPPAHTLIRNGSPTSESDRPATPAGCSRRPARMPHHRTTARGRTAHPGHPHPGRPTRRPRPPRRPTPRRRPRRPTQPAPHHRRPVDLRGRRRLEPTPPNRPASAITNHANDLPGRAPA